MLLQVAVSLSPLLLFSRQLSYVSRFVIVPRNGEVQAVKISVPASLDEFQVSQDVENHDSEYLAEDT